MYFTLFPVKQPIMAAVWSRFRQITSICPFLLIIKICTSTYQLLCGIHSSPFFSYFFQHLDTISTLQFKLNMHLHRMNLNSLQTSRNVQVFSKRHQNKACQAFRSTRPFIEFRRGCRRQAYLEILCCCHFDVGERLGEIMYSSSM